MLPGEESGDAQKDDGERGDNEAQAPGSSRHPAGDWSRTPGDDDDHMPAHSPTGPRPDFVSAMPRLFFKHNSVFAALRVGTVNASPYMTASLCDTWKIKTRLHQMHLL